MKNPGSPGSNQRHLLDRKIALYQLSQILNYKTDGSSVNFSAWISNLRRKPQRMLIMEIRRNADHLTKIYTATLSRFGSGPRPTRRCMQARSHKEHAVAKRGHQRLFFLVREKGGFVPTLRTPLGYVPGFGGVFWGVCFRTLSAVVSRFWQRFRRLGPLKIGLVILTNLRKC